MVSSLETICHRISFVWTCNNNVHCFDFFFILLDFGLIYEQKAFFCCLDICWFCILIFVLSTRRFINLKNCFKFHWTTEAYFFLNYSLRTNSAILIFFEKRTISGVLSKKVRRWWSNHDQFGCSSIFVHIFYLKKWNRVNAFEDQCILFSFWLKNTFSLHQNWNRFLLLFPQILNLFHSGSIGLFVPQWHWTHFIQHLSTHLCIESHYFH